MEVSWNYRWYVAELCLIAPHSHYCRCLLYCKGNELSLHDTINLLCQYTESMPTDVTVNTFATGFVFLLLDTCICFSELTRLGSVPIVEHSLGIGSSPFNQLHSLIPCSFLI